MIGQSERRLEQEESDTLAYRPKALGIPQKLAPGNSEQK